MMEEGEDEDSPELTPEQMQQMQEMINVITSYSIHYTKLYDVWKRFII